MNRVRTLLIALLSGSVAAFLPGCHDLQDAHDHEHLHHHHDGVDDDHDEGLHSVAVVEGTPTVPQGDAAMERATREMAQAALSFWASLSPELKAKCSFPFDDEERFNWHYIPRTRKGITWNDMNSAQQHLAHAFLSSALSNRGYQQVESIMSLDQVLK